MSVCIWLLNKEGDILNKQSAQEGHMRNMVCSSWVWKRARSLQYVRFKHKHYLQKLRKTSQGYPKCVLNSAFAVLEGRNLKLHLYAWEVVLSRTSASCYLCAIIEHIHFITCFCQFSEPWIFVLWSYFLWLIWLVSCTLIDT